MLLNNSRCLVRARLLFMSKLCRVFWLIYLLLVIPLQGMAAVGIGLCQHQIAKQTSQLEHLQPKQDIDSTRPACHSQVADYQSADQHRCSLCAVCHMGMAMMPTQFHLTTLQFAHPEWQPYAIISRPDHVPDFPDRPPRAHHFHS